MTPIDVAEKWTKAALALWDNSHTSDPNVLVLTLRARTHYGNHKPALSELVAVAMVEAMNEWQMYATAPMCARCDSHILPTQQAELASDNALRHANRANCT